uniref:Vesicle transport protein USE1 n=1 Tax=Takifugu rubripes TaxID=31033 RepID=A0A3B5JXH5_TAKRU
MRRVSASNMASRLEINFTRLLSRCESIASEKRGETEWRLEKYVGSLEEMLAALRKSHSKPTAEVLTEYTRKVDFLKGLLEAEKLPSPTDKALANQFLAPGRTPTIANERMSATKTVHMQTKGRCTAEMRDELLSTVRATDLRNRRGLPLDERQSAAELEAVLQHHHNLQEKLAEDMLNLARNLKNNTLAAQNIIKQDNQTLGQSMRQADVNLEKLKTESERLEQHTKKSINWLLWLMLILVSFIFISMILFIRIFPRLR